MTISQIGILPTTATAASARADWRDALAVLAIVGLFIALAAGFLPHQSIWIDETTQLSGLAMSPGEVVSFLTGHHAPIGVPPDRNPPLAYWAGQAWAAMAGLTEHSLRWFGVLCVAWAIACVYLAARRFGRVPAILAAAFLALSPSVINTSVEIRAYPLYLLLSAAAFWALLDQLPRPFALRLSSLVLPGLLMAAIYTHFFGVMLAGAVLCGWLAFCLLNRQSIKPPLLTGLVVFASAAGLYPFVHSASTVSGSPTESTSLLRGLLKLPINQLTHPAMRLAWLGLPDFSARTLAIAAACVAVPLGIYRASKLAQGRTLLIAVVAGLCAVVLAAVAIKKFNPLASNYNLWCLPPLALIIGLAASGPRGPGRTIGVAAGMGLLAAGALGGLELSRHGEAFAHGPQNQIFALIDQYELQNIALIEDADTAGAVDFTAIFPLRYRYKNTLQRYSVAPPDAQGGVLIYDDNKRTQTPEGVRVDPMPIPPGLARTVIVVQTQDIPGDQLAAALTAPPAFGDGPACRALLAAGYRKVESHFFLASAAAQVDVLQR